ncbi:MAG: hypothetical protein M1825_000829 [Sarcosagium campestre]|nr:MAG: hypothetical protein M1825_000829 [Sarcosagium campestre]
MTNGSVDSCTTTSHTLSNDPEPSQAPSADLHPFSTSALVATLTNSPISFLQPGPSLHSAALVLAKRYLDPIASSVSVAQTQRQQQQQIQRKRKRGAGDGLEAASPLQLQQLYLDGFDIDQIWHQARQVLNAASDEVERNLPRILNGQDHDGSDSVQDRESSGGKDLRLVRFDEDGFEISDAGESVGEDTRDSELFENETKISDVDSLSYDDQDDLQDIDDNDKEEEEEEDEEADGLEDDSADDKEPVETFVVDPHGLNDGFFSIDDFNKQSELLERQDAARNPNDGSDSDEDDIDWDMDPNLMTAAQEKTGYRDDYADDQDDESGSIEDESEEDENDDGPTFGNMDLHAPEGASEDEMDLDDANERNLDDVGGLENTNEIYYKDFFEPPPRRASQKGRPSKHTREVNAQNQKKALGKRPQQDDAATLQRTMDAVRRDLLDDDVSELSEASDDQRVRANLSDPKARKSTHERNQAKIAAEIRKLEAANVAKREWTLAGEARASDRPLNSLLEEDLDFERTGKPVPVITAEVSESIEELIKRRILDRQFDEVIRRRPDSIFNPSEARRGRFELDDSKAKQSLAEMYEEEHLRKIDPEGQQSKRDEKVNKEHAEVEALWKDVSAKLDALSSWHYKPKPAKPSVNIVADVPTVAVEDARPTAAIGGAGADLGSTSMLAPQELYLPGKEKPAAGEVVLKSGVPIAREEMSREEKVRRRRRAKERTRKSNASKSTSAAKPGDGGGGKESRKEVVGQLKKGGVRVIGKKGEVRDVEGKTSRDVAALSGGGHLKL